MTPLYDSPQPRTRPGRSTGFIALTSIGLLLGTGQALVAQNSQDTPLFWSPSVAGSFAKPSPPIALMDKALGPIPDTQRLDKDSQESKSFVTTLGNALFVSQAPLSNSLPGFTFALQRTLRSLRTTLGTVSLVRPGAVQVVDRDTRVWTLRLRGTGGDYAIEIHVQKVDNSWKLSYLGALQPLDLGSEAHRGLEAYRLELQGWINHGN